MNDPHTQIRHHKAGRTAILKVPTTFDVRIVPEVPTTVTAAARTRLDAVTDWITARQGGTLPIPSVIDAAVAILTAPPDNNDVTVSVHPATVYRIDGHLVAVYHQGTPSGPVAIAECSCPGDDLCEHLLVALAGTEECP
jgi:hypothetical protein